jgi:iron complex outermembrane receptor protein
MTESSWSKPPSQPWLIAATVRRALQFSAIATMAATASWAADAPTADSDTQLQEVVVTGSLIARPASETAEAVTIVTATDFQNQGVTNVEQVLSQITSATPSLVNISSSVGSFSGGGTFADLRGIGEGRTLVLLDGQRLANNASTGNAVDLSGIPFAALDSVEVLREGASALYGSDAIAGVVNFITKKNYQGLEVQGNLDHTTESGGRSWYVNVTGGHGDLVNDGYNAMVALSFSRQDELQAAERDFSRQGFDPARGITATNDPGTWPGTFLDSNGNYFQSGYPGCAGNPFPTTYFGNCAYRYTVATDLVPDSKEWSGLAAITKSLPGDNQVKLQYLFGRSEIVAWSGPMFYAFPMTPADNPTYYPKSTAGLTCWQGACPATADLADGGYAIWSDPGNNRYTGYLNQEQRVTLTFSGKNAGWDYSVGYNFSQNNSHWSNNADFPDEAMLVQPDGSLSDLINPFGPQSAAGQALINSSYVNGDYAVGRTKRWSFDGSASHELGDAFNAGRPATVAIGFMVEGEDFMFRTTPYNDLVSAATGYTDQTILGSRTSQALFMELDVPVTKGFDFDVSDREDKYSDFGRTNNGKVTLRYQPVEMLTFRGAASTGFRAPTLYDLYKPNNLSASSGATMGTGNPECVAPYPNPEWSQATCNTQGLGLYGGNRTLQPETSENFDLGIVISPIKDLGITVDWYRINLKNTISTIPVSAIYGNPTGLASSIVTNSSGTLTPSIDEASQCQPSYSAATCGYILQNFQNTGAITTQGFDVSIQYSQRTPIGKFHEDLEGTTVSEFRWQEYQYGPTLNLVGNEATSGYQPQFRWNHNVRVDWTSNESVFGAGLSNRFYSSYYDENGILPDNSGPREKVGAYSIWNAYVSYKPIKQLTVMLGIQNILNTDPPFTNAVQSNSNFTAGYNNTLTNPLGRTISLNVKYDVF